jgi:hypothetical protein
MRAAYILAGVGAGFLLLGLLRVAGSGGLHPQARTWLMVGAIFIAIGGWLLFRG